MKIARLITDSGMQIIVSEGLHKFALIESERRKSFAIIKRLWRVVLAVIADVHGH